MDSKRKLFIYDRREVGILILLGVGVALFAFTLGLHLGKQVNPAVIEGHAEAKPGEPVHAAPAAAPSRTEISEEVKNVPGAVEDTLDQTLRDEVTQSGLKLATPKPLKLPEQRKAVVERIAPVVAPTAASKSEPKSEPKVETTVNEVHAEFSLQTGSYPKRVEAEAALKVLVDKGLSGEIRTAEIQGKGTWFRVVAGKYKNSVDAEKAGKVLKEEKQIEEFIVVKATGN